VLRTCRAQPPGKEEKGDNEETMKSKENENGNDKTQAKGNGNAMCKKNEGTKCHVAISRPRGRLRGKVHLLLVDRRDWLVDRLHLLHRLHMNRLHLHWRHVGRLHWLHGLLELRWCLNVPKNTNELPQINHSPDCCPPLPRKPPQPNIEKDF
jgi:hypothetical protein